VAISTYHHTGPLELWMGTWTSTVLSKRRTSNWKELESNLETLQFEAKREFNRFWGQRVYYFSDNSENCDVLRKCRSKNFALQKLVLDIKALEIELGYRLVAIHIPSTVVIYQGADNHNQSVWTTPLNHVVQLPTMSVFTPASYSPGL
jgi:hypothetical protein